MGDISLREMVAILRLYTVLPGMVPLGLREIANAIVADDVGVAFPFSCRNLLPILADPRILQVISDPPPDHQGATWTSDIVNGKEWFVDSDGPEFAWVQVEAPSEELDAPVTAVAGRVIGPEVAQTDFPFHHPFGNDWECYVDVDPKFRGVLSPLNGTNPQSGSDYQQAAKQAPHAPETGPHQGVLGVEWDAQLVPFQPGRGGPHRPVWAMDTRRRT